MDLLSQVRASVVDVHVFFEDWFMGRVDKAALDSHFLNLLEPGFCYIPPGGPVVGREALKAQFLDGYGSVQAFKIMISDVVIRWQSDSHVLASYIETQTGAAPPAEPKNARLSSVLIAKTDPLMWCYVQETALAS